MFATFAVPSHVHTREALRRAFNHVAPAELQFSGYAALSMWEQPDGVRIEVDLPGLQPNQVEVTVEEGKLFIRGERATPQAEQKCRHNERRYGRFQRVVALGETIDPTTIEAQLRDGVLAVTLRKKPDAQPQKVAVKYQLAQSNEKTADAS